MCLSIVSVVDCYVVRITMYYCSSYDCAKMPKFSYTYMRVLIFYVLLDIAFAAISYIYIYGKITWLLSVDGYNCGLFRV